MDTTIIQQPNVSTTVLEPADDLDVNNRRKSEIARLRLEKEQDQQDVLLSQSIIKRRNWMQKYKVSEKIVFELFAEFSSMMHIHKKDYGVP